MDNLHDKVALVTGGGSGINLAFVQLLVQSGVKVLIADLTLHPTANEWIASLPASTASQVNFHRTDVTIWSNLSSALDTCESTFGSVPDIVVPGAGVYEPSSNSFWSDNDDFDASRYKVIDIDLIHPIKLTRMAIRRMLKVGKKHSCIIHVSSISAQRSSLITPLYTASKHGISSFVRGMAPLEDLVGIRVVAVAPGTVGTPLFTEHPEAAKFLDLTKDLLLPPEEIARAMFALLTDGKKYPSGTVLEVCDVGGRWREVSLLNDPGPTGPASASSRKVDAAREILEMLEREAGGERRTGTDVKVVTD